MDEYNKLMENIKSYFDLEDVECTEDVISAYDLYYIINDKFALFRETINGDEFENQVNEFNTITTKTGRIFKKTVTIREKSVEYIHVQVEDGVAQFSICLSQLQNNKEFRYHTCVCKDIDSDQLYYSYKSEDIQDVIDAFLPQIEEYLNNIIEFYRLYTLTDASIPRIPTFLNSASITQVFSDNFLNIAISYDTYGRIKYEFSINDTQDPKGLFKREWVNLKRIKDVVDENAEVLLRKIPVNIAELNETTVAIVKEYNTKQKDIRMLQLSGKH